MAALPLVVHGGPPQQDDDAQGDGEQQVPVRLVHPDHIEALQHQVRIH